MILAGLLVLAVILIRIVLAGPLWTRLFALVPYGMLAWLAALAWQLGIRRSGRLDGAFLCLFLIAINVLLLWEWIVQRVA